MASKQGKQLLCAAIARDISPHCGQGTAYLGSSDRNTGSQEFAIVGRSNHLKRCNLSRETFNDLGNFVVFKWFTDYGIYQSGIFALQFLQTAVTCYKNRL